MFHPFNSHSHFYLSLCFVYSQNISCLIYPSLVHPSRTLSFPTSRRFHLITESTSKSAKFQAQRYQSFSTSLHLSMPGNLPYARTRLLLAHDSNQKIRENRLVLPPRFPLTFRYLPDFNGIGKHTSIVPSIFPRPASGNFSDATLLSWFQPPPSMTITNVFVA